MISFCMGPPLQYDAVVYIHQHMGGVLAFHYTTATLVLGGGGNAICTGKAVTSRLAGAIVCDHQLTHQSHGAPLRTLFTFVYSKLNFSFSYTTISILSFTNISLGTIIHGLIPRGLELVAPVVTFHFPSVSKK